MGESRGGRVPVLWDWRYENDTGAEVSLWLAIPPVLPSQPEVEVRRSFPAGFGLEDIRPAGPNRLAFVSLPPGGRAGLMVRAVLDGGGGPHLAGDHEISAYVNSGPLISANPEVRAEADRVTGTGSSPLDAARRLYLHLLKTCRYTWPPTERGSETMRASRRGDCGEYAFLYAALCRSLGLPCRVLIGALLGRRMLPHAWNEVYLPGDGWVRVDALLPEILLGRLAARSPARPAAWAARSLERRFGRCRPDRLAFSIDPGVVLDPPFGRRAAPEGARDLTIDGRPFAWGFETLPGGRAPYLQPCYVRFGGEKPPRASAAYLGSWSLTKDG